MLLNTPMITIIDDNDHQAVVKISALYTSANAGYNVTAVTANALFGGNASQNCVLSVNSVEYTSSIANGSLALEFVYSGNNANNLPICTFGRANDGQINRYINNQITAHANVAGDINLFASNLEANDSFTLVVSVLKEYQGQYWISGGVGSGAWSNAQAHYLAGKG